MNLKRYICFLLFLFMIVGTIPSVGAASEEGVVWKAISIKTGDKIKFSDVAYQDGVITVSGTTGEGSGAEVSMRVLDGEKKELICLNQTAADLNGKFAMRFAPGEFKKVIVMLAGVNTTVTQVTLAFSDYTTAAANIAALKESLKECETLFAQCKARNISTEYETMYYNMILRSADIMTDEVGLQTDADIIDYNLPIAYLYLDTITANLRAYLSGEKEPLRVPVVQPESVSYSGKNFIGTVTENGQTKTQPVYFNGFGMGFGNRDETENFAAMGQNVTTDELPAAQVIGLLNRPVGWNLNPGGAGYPDADFVVTSTEKASASSAAALKIVNRSAAADNKQGYLWQQVVLQPNKTYRFGGKFKGNAKKVTVAFGFANDVAVIDKNYTSWQSFDYTYKTKADQYENKTILIWLGDTAEGVYFDDFYLYEGSDTTNLLDNPGFEYGFDESVDGTLGVSTGMIREFKQKLDRYADNGLSCVLDPQLYGLGAYLNDVDGAIEDKRYNSHLPYSITHPRVLELTKLYFDKVLPVVKDCKALKWVQITNEPGFDSSGSAYYLPQWQQWIERKYQTIANLNSVYGASYTAFTNVPMESTATKQNAHYNDWREFNDSIMTEYNQKVAEYIHAQAPSIAAMTKIKMYVDEQESPRFPNQGTNYEDMSQAFDVNGNDAWSYFGLRGGIFAPNMWYDLQTSILDRPVFNLENHVIVDNKTIDYSRNHAGNLRSSVWQGALHGLSGNLTWLWSKSDHVENGYFRNTTMQYRLDCMIESGKLTYDLNRLANEVSALANKEPDVALLYSYTSPIYDTKNKTHENRLAEVYKKLVCSGMKPVFVTEEDFSNLDKCDVLIVPYARYVPEKTLDSVLAAAGSGKKIILLDADSLKYNENKQEQPQDKLTALQNAAQIYAVNEISVMTEAVNAQYNSSKVSVTKGEGKDSVEVSSVKMGNRVIINLCNLDEKTAQTLSVQYDGKDMGRCVDLIDGEEYDTSNIVLPPLTPVMLEFELNKLTITEESGEIAAAALFHDFADAGTNAVLYLAAYDVNNKLTATATGRGAITETGTDISARISAGCLTNGGYIKAFLWKEDTMQPLCNSKLYRKE